MAESFHLLLQVDMFQPQVDAPILQNRESVNPEEVSIFLKEWAKKSGAHSVGITLLKPHHIYSHVGRGKEYGNKVELNHKFAIAFTVEMDYSMIQRAPKGPGIMESAHQYLNAGEIAIQIAQFIRNLGFTLPTGRKLEPIAENVFRCVRIRIPTISFITLFAG